MEQTGKTALVGFYYRFGQNIRYIFKMSKIITDCVSARNFFFFWLLPFLGGRLILHLASSSMVHASWSSSFPPAWQLHPWLVQHFHWNPPLHMPRLNTTENMLSTLPGYVPRRRTFRTFPGLFPPQGPHSLHYFKVKKKKRKKKADILEVHTGQFPGGDLSCLASPSITTAELHAARLRAPIFI